MAAASKVVRQCAWCDAIFTRGKWEPYHQKIHGENVSHGICPPCEKDQYAKYGLGQLPKHNPDPLLGAIIVDIRPATAEDKRKIGWRADYMVIELSSGALLFAASDLEFNDAGVLNYIDVRDGQVRTLVPPGRKRG